MKKRRFIFEVSKILDDLNIAEEFPDIMVIAKSKSNDIYTFTNVTDDDQKKEFIDRLSKFLIEKFNSIKANSTKEVDVEEFIDLNSFEIISSSTFKSVSSVAHQASDIKSKYLSNKDPMEMTDDELNDLIDLKLKDEPKESKYIQIELTQITESTVFMEVSAEKNGGKSPSKIFLNSISLAFLNALSITNDLKIEVNNSNFCELAITRVGNELTNKDIMKLLDDFSNNCGPLYNYKIILN